MLNSYTLGPERSRFTVQAFAGGMLSGFGHSPTFAVRDFRGTMQFASETSENASLQITVTASSLKLTDNVKENDRQEIERTLQQDVLESGKYAEIEFRSTEIAATFIAENWYRVRIIGPIQLHGVTTPKEIDAQLRISDSEVRLSGEFKLSLSAYRIKQVSAMAGMIKVKDELKFVFDLVGQKQQQEAP